MRRSRFFATIAYNPANGGVERLVANDMARWIEPGRRWEAINGVELISEVPAAGVGEVRVPVFAPTVSINGITTEGSRATIQYAVSYTAAAPFHQVVCVDRDVGENVHFNDNCDRQTYTNTVHAIRTDDGRWTLMQE